MSQGGCGLGLLRERGWAGLPRDAGAALALYRRAARAGWARALARLGVENVALYDGSLTEWTSDPDLPIETG